MSTSLVLLPTYNERANLSRVVPRLSALKEDVDVLVIDDASPDGTGELAEELKHTYPHLSVLHRRKKEGLGRAYVHGFREALRRGYSRIVTMDADLSHAPEDVPRLLEVRLGASASAKVSVWPGLAYADVFVHHPRLSPEETCRDFIRGEPARKGSPRTRGRRSGNCWSEPGAQPGFSQTQTECNELRNRYNGGCRKATRVAHRGFVHGVGTQKPVAGGRGATQDAAARGVFWPLPHWSLGLPCRR